MVYGKKKKEKIILITILVLLVIINYQFIDSLLEKKLSGEGAVLIEVERVIDGDTLVVNGSSMRLLGINSPEKGEKYYEEAKNFLEELTLNRTLVMKSKGQDKYYRELVYLFDLDNKKNINLEIVKNGYANYYFPSGKDEYYKDFVKAWNKCLNSRTNLCQISEDVCKGCIEVEEWGYNKDVILYNICEINCSLEGWSIKDEGRKIFTFEEFILDSGKGVQVTPEAFDVEYVWTKSGDSIFIRDGEDRLVFWDSY